MIKARKKWLSILLTLTFLLSILLPAGTAFAAGEINVSATVEPVEADKANQQLGAITITPGSQTLDATVYMTVDYPKAAVVASTLSTTVTAVYESGGISTATVTTDVDSVSGNVYAKFDVPKNATKIVINSTVKTTPDVTGDISVNVSAKRVNANGIQVWTFGPQAVKVATVATKKVTASAGSAPVVTEGTDKQIAEISLAENIAGALSTSDEVYLELPSTYFAWKTAGTLSGLEVVGSVSGQKLTVKRSAAPGTMPETFKLTGATITVFPGAPQGDVVVEVTGSAGSKVEAANLVVAKVGAVGVRAEVKDNLAAKDLYPAKNNQQIEDIVIKSDSALPAGQTLIMTLNTGKWNTTASATYNGLDFLGAFNDGKSVWFKVEDGNTLKETTLTGLKVNLPADAVLGDLKVTLGGSLGLTGDLVVSKVVSRINVSAAKPEVKVGLGQAAGDITITETAKDTLEDGKVIKLTLPTGVTFATDAKYKVNANPEITLTIAGKAYAEIPLSGLSAAAVDTIVVSGIKYDIDSRVPLGDIKVEIGGSALNALPALDGAKAVLTVANATVVSPTKRNATFVIGSTTYKVNGVEYTMDVAPYIKKDRTFMPVRYAALAAGVEEANIIWDGVKKSVTLIKGDRVVQMTIGSKTMLINGIAITMDVALEIVAPGRTMLPFRPVAQALGATVTWDGTTQTVTMKVP